MIIVHLMGGVGNQLFQYAAGKALATRRGVALYYTFEDQYKLAKRSVKVDKFTIQSQPLPSGVGRDYFPARKLNRLVRKALGLNYDGRIFREELNLTNNALVSGYMLQACTLHETCNMHPVTRANPFTLNTFTECSNIC